MSEQRIESPAKVLKFHPKPPKEPELLVHWMPTSRFRYVVPSGTRTEDFHREKILQQLWRRIDTNTTVKSKYDVSIGEIVSKEWRDIPVKVVIMSDRFAYEEE